MTRGNNNVADLQRRAWSYYGVPGLTGARAVGEVHYVNSWLADQMTRLDWDVLIDGEPVWTVTDIPGQDAPITTTEPAGDGTDPEQDLTRASAELLALIDWTDSNVRSVTTNLFVAGQGDYIFDSKAERWRVVSVVERDRVETIKKAQDRVPFIWPHPADPSMPDAPLFSVLELLDELDWLSRQGRSQSSQRVLINGILATADGFDKDNSSTVWDAFNAAMTAKMANPDDMSPIRISGPLDLIKDGINWIVPDFGYDAVLDRKVLSCINRLAYGLPVPPEILLGMQAQSRATAFQVEENAYRAHIEPPAWMVAQVAQDALNDLLDQTVEVVPNPSALLARRNSVEDTKWAYTEGLADGTYTREVLAIPEDAAPLDDGVPPGSSAPIEPDPANVAADEPVTAAASPDDLSTLLADIDFHLSSELAGATAMATDRARQRLGGAARVNPEVRGNTELKKLKNGSLAVELGVDGLTNAGVDIGAQITEPLESVAEWWGRRVSEAWSQTETLVPGWSGQPGWVTQSSDSLVQALTTHVVETLGQPTPPPLDAEQIRTVVNLAAGGGV